MLQFSLVNIPIKLYGAVETGTEISFRQLHRTDHEPIGYEKVCKGCRTKVESADIVKGYEYEPNKYVIIDDSDFDKVRLKSTKTIEIEAFVDIEEIPRSLYDQPYFIGPDGDVAAKPFQLILEAMQHENKAAIARVVMREKEHLVAIVAGPHGIILYKLRYTNEVRSLDQLPKYSTPTVPQAQIDMAVTLMGTMQRRFQDLDLHNRYNEALAEVIRAKIDGKEIAIPSESKPEPAADIMQLLTAAIAASKPEKEVPAPAKKKPAKKSARAKA